MSAKLCSELGIQLGAKTNAIVAFMELNSLLPATFTKLAPVRDMWLTGALLWGEEGSRAGGPDK